MGWSVGCVIYRLYIYILHHIAIYHIISLIEYGQFKQLTQLTITGWWFGTFGLFSISYIRDIILPILTFIFFKMVETDMFFNHQPDKIAINDPINILTFIDIVRISHLI